VVAAGLSIASPSWHWAAPRDDERDKDHQHKNGKIDQSCHKHQRPLLLLIRFPDANVESSNMASLESGVGYFYLDTGEY